MTSDRLYMVAQFAIWALLAAAIHTLVPFANAQLAACINQCDAIGYQCERNVNDEHERCLDQFDSQIQVCEQQGNEKRNYCLRNRAPSCDLSGQFEFDRCVRFLQPCELNGQRCDAAMRTCVQRCENDSAAIQPRERPSSRPKPQPRISDMEADYRASLEPEIRIYKFEHSDQLNEFKLVEEDQLFVRNLRPNGKHGKWHKYLRAKANIFKAITSNATYTLEADDKFVWTDGTRTITLFRQDD